MPASKLPSLGQKCINFRLNMGLIKTMKFEHQPVLLREAVEGLSIKEDGIYVDATLGGGGHASEILKAISQKGKLIGIDRDPEAIAFTKEKLADYAGQVILVNENYSEIGFALDQLGISEVDGILADLGVSSHQLTHPTRGFSLKGSAPLDMRMGNTRTTAADILNKYSVQELDRIFRDYGEERHAKGIAMAVVQERTRNLFKTTDQLTNLVEKFYRGKSKPKKIHPATKIYQALRIEVNEELVSLEKFLVEATSHLKVGGRLSVITFHSLEDRIVKQFLKSRSISVKQNKYRRPDEEVPKGELELINKKPITASEEELAENPRARSAKLRIAQKN